MNRDDVELVVSKVVEFLKPSLKEKISMVEIFDLSQIIIEEIKFEKNLEDESIQYCISRTDCEKIMLHGVFYLSFHISLVFYMYIFKSIDMKQMQIKKRFR